MKRTLLTGVVACWLALFATAADAAPLTLTAFDNGTLALLCTDNASCDTDPTVGVINISSLSTANFTTSLLASSSSLATPGLSSVDLQTTTSRLPGSAPGAATLVIDVGDTDFVSPANGGLLFSFFLASFSGAIPNNGDGLSLASFASDSNVLYATDVAAPLIDYPFDAEQGIILDFSETPFPALAPFSIFGRTTITLSSDTTSVDTLGGTIVAVPEPGLLALLGVGMIGVARSFRRNA